MKLHLHYNTLKTPQDNKFVDFKAKLGKTEQEDALSRVTAHLAWLLHSCRGRCAFAKDSSVIYNGAALL